MSLHVCNIASYTCVLRSIFQLKFMFNCAIVLSARDLLHKGPLSSLGLSLDLISKTSCPCHDDFSSLALFSYPRVGTPLLELHIFARFINFFDFVSPMLLMYVIITLLSDPFCFSSKDRPFLFFGQIAPHPIRFESDLIKTFE